MIEIIKISDVTIEMIRTKGKLLAKLLGENIDNTTLINPVIRKRPSNSILNASGNFF